MTELLRQAWAIVAKDIALEARTGQRFSAVVGFAVMTGLLAHYALEPNVVNPEDVTSLLVWLTIVFAGTGGIGRTFELEELNGAWDAVLHTPVSRPILFLAKVASNALLVLLLVGVVIVVIGLFFHINFFAAPAGFWLAILIGSVGFIAAGTFFSAITVRSNMGATLLPILLFPLLVPVLVFGATATARSLAGTTSGVGGELRLLSAYAILSLVAGSLLFSSVVDDA